MVLETTPSCPCLYDEGHTQNKDAFPCKGQVVKKKNHYSVKALPFPGLNKEIALSGIQTYRNFSQPEKKIPETLCCS